MRHASKITYSFGSFWCASHGAGRWLLGFWLTVWGLQHEKGSSRSQHVFEISTCAVGTKN